METVKLGPGSFFLLLLVAAVSLLFLEYGGVVPQQGALLLTLVFWSSLAQGCVALVAATDLTNARWIASLRQELLSAVRLLPFLAFLLLLLIPRLSLYPWGEAPGLWLNEVFFLLRNLALLLLTWWSGGRFARRSLAADPRKKEAAVLYLFFFIVSQTLVAFDLVMSLAYPWVSSLLGAFFFVESLYAAIALAALSFFFLFAEKERATGRLARAHLRDVGLLLFGFSVLWTGLFFAQYLLLWYGNLPEEVGFIAERLATPSRQFLAAFTLCGTFLVPFLVLLPRRAKEKPALLAAVAAAVLGGIYLERLLLVLPAIPLHPGIAAFQNLLIFGLWLTALHSRDELLPKDVR